MCIGMPSDNRFKQKQSRVNRGAKQTAEIVTKSGRLYRRAKSIDIGEFYYLIYQRNFLLKKRT